MCLFLGCNQNAQDNVRATTDTLTSTLSLSADTSDIRRQLLNQIPVGTIDTIAVSIMQRHGFVCDFMHQSKWIGNSEPTDFIHCDRQEKGSSVIRRWQVAIFIVNHLVIEIQVVSGLIGP